MSGRRWLWILIVLVAVLAVYWYTRSYVPGITTTSASTKLEITVIGGFAFVPTPADRHLEIAYLNDFILRKDTNGNGTMEPNEPVEFVDTNGNGVRDPGERDTCNVDQIGTELKVTRGTISTSEPTSLPVPASREFNLDKAVVTFPALEGASLPLTIGKGPWPPSPDLPGNPDNEGDWKDMVPGLREYHSGTTINPNWRKMVNGRVVLRGGEIKATLPSSPIMKKAHFEFKANNVLKFKAAMTDKLIYTADVPAGEIEILLSGAAIGFTRLVIQPQGNKVELTLRGLHASSGQPMPNMPLHDFCTFYQLLQPMPLPTDFLLPHYIPAQKPPGSGPYAMPSPGFFCDGNWF